MSASHSQMSNQNLGKRKESDEGNSDNVYSIKKRWVVKRHTTCKPIEQPSGNDAQYIEEIKMLTSSTGDPAGTSGQGKGPMPKTIVPDNNDCDEVFDDEIDDEFDDEIDDELDEDGLNSEEREELYLLKRVPTNFDLLTHFFGHVADEIRKKKTRNILTCHPRNLLLSILPLDFSKMMKHVHQTGLYHLNHGMLFHGHNMPLIQHLFGEMGITLHDVHYILDIPVIGKPIVTKADDNFVQIKLQSLLDLPLSELNSLPEVKSQWKAKDGLVKNKLQSLLDLSPLEVNSLWKSGYINSEVLVAKLDEAHISYKSFAIVYLLWLFGETLFVGESAGYIDARLLLLLLDLSDAKNYAWGAGALALLYRQLGLACQSGPTHIWRFDHT